MANMQTGNMSSILGNIYSVGTGRGIAVLISCLGLMLLIIVGIALFNSRLRNIDSELADININIDEPRKDTDSSSINNGSIDKISA